MKSPIHLFALALALGASCQSIVISKPREPEWRQVAAAVEQEQPRTAIELLEKLQTAAYADHAWAEGAKAQAMRLSLAGELAGGIQHTVKQLAREIPAAPAPARPVLRLLHAQWWFGYYQENRWQFAKRSATGATPGEDFETWDLGRLLTEIDRSFQASLTDGAGLRNIPVADFDALLDKGDFGDDLRPTLYDFLAHSALEFYALEETAAACPQEAFRFGADSPALGPVAAFLAWDPPTPDAADPKYRALRLYQELLAGHRADPDPTAFLHCDLRRLCWAGAAATGRDRAAALDRALRAFIEANAAHPLSAAARLEVAGALEDSDATLAAHAMALAGATAFPAHPYGKSCLTFVHRLEAKDLDLTVADHWTPAGEPITVAHTNLDHLWFRAYLLPWAPGADTLDSEPVPETDRELARVLGTRPARAWEAALPDDHDFRARTTVLPAPVDLPAGYYLIVASANKGFSAKQNQLAVRPVHVTRYAVNLRDDNSGALSGLVTDAATGAPLAGVRVTAVRERTLLPGLARTTATSDADGWFSIRCGTKDASLLVIAGTDPDVAVMRPFVTPGDAANSSRQVVAFFTDRAIYRPGQPIRFKAIWCEADARRGNYRTLGGQTTTVSLRDPNENEVAKLELTTNDHGSGSGIFTAPAGLNGTYTLAAGKLGATTVRIEEYKRPKFEVKLRNPAAPAALGAEVALTGSAMAFTGAPVDGAAVRWSVTRSGLDWDGLGGDFIRPEPGSVIARGTAVTAADGTFSVGFTATPDPDADPAAAAAASYRITAEVTDGTGETRTATTSVIVGAAALRAEIGADEWLAAAPRQVVLRVRTTTHAHDGIPAAGTLTIRRLVQPVRCARDSDDRPLTAAGRLAEDDPTDPATWAVAEVVTEIPVQTAALAAKGQDAGTAEVPVSLPAGCYRAAFRTQDAGGHKVEATATLQVVDPAADRYPASIPFRAVTDRAEAEPGQPITLLWGSGHPVARACVEWFRDGVLLRREWSRPGRTQQTFTLTPDESMRGGVSVLVTQTTLNRLHEFSETIDIPWTNKQLTLRWEHLTSKLTPGVTETWTAIITGPDGKPAPAEMVATLYDASLDAFAGHFFGDFDTYHRHDETPFSDGEFSAESGKFDLMVTWPGRDDFHSGTPFRRFTEDLDIPASDFSPSFCMAKPAPRRQGTSNILTGGLRSGDAAISRNSVDALLNRPGPFDAAGNYREAWAEAAHLPAAPAIATRRNLEETAFFLPHLTSDAKGEIRLTFTMPEALTEWRFLGFAHDRDLRWGSLEGRAATSKDLMVQPNPPRFLREGDTLDFTVKITNRGERPQSGTATLTLAEAATLKDATAALGVTQPAQPWTLAAGESRALSWRLTVPDGCGFLNFKATATGGSLTDGEEGWLPVIPRRVLLTESMNLPIRGAGNREFAFRKLLDSAGSPTLEHRSLRVQTVSRPAWYAVMALPYLMEFPHECAEQTFHRYYANALAHHLATSDPRLRQVFEQWRASPAPDHPLAGNSDLAGIMLEETPWLAEATDPAQARQRLGVLFDTNRLDAELDRTLGKLRDLQRPDGLWPWFAGGPGDRHITLRIATGFARLRAAGVPTDITPALKALARLDADLTEKFAALRQQDREHPGVLKGNHLDPTLAEYLHTRTLFLKDRKPDLADQPAMDYFTGQARQYWPKLDSRLSRAQIALALARLGDTATAKGITRSLREHAVTDADTGMSWRDAEGEPGCHWWQAPVESQAMMIEAFRDIDGDDRAVEACQAWLISQKQVRDWGSTTATADAIHALLRGGGDWLAPVPPLEVALGGTAIRPDAAEPGTGFWETRFAGPAVKPELGAIKLTQAGPGLAWAGIHWQYLEDLARVTPHQGAALRLEKSVFVRKPGPAGSVLEAVAGPVRPGDELVTRLVITNDRTLEYVHLKDQRGSGTEPVNVLSGYRWLDGFGCYEVTRDTASHFFIDVLPAGTHVIETAVRVQHTGLYQSGLAEIRCMYAPAFAAHSGSVPLKAE